MVVSGPRPAARPGALGRNPCRSVRLYKQRSRERFMTLDEYRRLGRVLKEAKRDGSVWPHPCRIELGLSDHVPLVLEITTLP